MGWMLWASGVIAGLAFMAGFILGAWSLRKIGYAIKVREEKFQAAKSLGGPRPQWGDPEPVVGDEHPHGPPPGTPESYIRRDSRKWTDMLSSIGKAS